MPAMAATNRSRQLHRQKDIDLLTQAEKDLLLNELWTQDRPLCHECLKGYQEHPERLCVFQPGHARCDSCAEKGIYCLRMRVNETRPLFRTAQRFAAEMVQLRLGGSPIPDRMRNAYRTVVEGALSYAEAVKEVKDLREDLEKATAATVTHLRQASECESRNEALSWAAKCGWTLVTLEKERRDKGLPPPQGGAEVVIMDMIKDARELRIKRGELDHRCGKLTEEVGKLRLENENLQAAQLAASATRDKLIEELRNSKATILAAEAAIERASLERMSKKELSRSLETSELQMGSGLMARTNTTPPNLLRRLPERVKQRIFQNILSSVISVDATFRERTQFPPQTNGMVNDETDKATITTLFHLGRSIDLDNDAALVMYISTNCCRTHVPGLDYRWTAADHAEILGLCLVAKEWMVRIIKAQVGAYIRLISVPVGDNRRRYRSAGVSVSPVQALLKFEDQSSPDRKRLRTE
ncbi:hypothetical protein PspLS_02917 [Pyricularia sp. CBS 133598]|nr:hypothetical protein PspLS_02917 [Pyricularia sp. CBS 133598]